MTGTKPLSACRLYGIVDLGYVGPPNAVDAAVAMISGGVDVIQLRAKRVEVAELTILASKLHAVTKPAGIPLIINDHPAVAREVGAEGVHVGQDDMPVALVREIAGANCIVGKSTHTVEQAQRAAAEGADYIGFGPLFSTPTKPDYPAIGLGDIRRVHDIVAVPIFCIGGIKLNNLPQVVTAGAQRVVIVSEMLQAADIARYARTARALLLDQPATSNR